MASHFADLTVEYEFGRSFRDTLYGKVRYAHHKKTQNVVIVKEYSKSLVERRISRRGIPICEDAHQEIATHRMLCLQPHPNVLQILDVGEDENMIYLVLELCEHGELFNIVTKSGKMNERISRSLFRQLMDGLFFIHSQGVCHRDMSLENILMSADGKLKISDFGVAVPLCPVLPGNPHRPGKTQYMSPEVFCGMDYDPAANDIWACGVILFIFSVGVLAPPFETPHKSDVRLSCILEGNLVKLLQHWGHFDISPDLVNLLSAILTPEEKRIKMDQILVHPWLNPNSPRL